MSQKVVLTREQVSHLLEHLDQQLACGSCDHTRRLTLAWARKMSIDAADLVDALDDSGGFCDCEVLMNVEPADLILTAPDVPTPPDNPWCLPPAFQVPAADHVFTKILKAVRREQANCYSADGNLLVPAPKGAKPRKRVRKSIGFFVGLADGLPCELGFVASCEAVTAPQFAKQVRDSGLPEFSAFKEREAAFVLSCLVTHQPETPIATHFMEVTGLSAKKPDQLRIHKVVLRRK